MTSFFRDDKGLKSMNRLLAFLGACIGITVAIGGLLGWLFGMLADGPIVIGLGLALFGGSEILKNHGKTIENK
jgi:hypothetical protein